MGTSYEADVIVWAREQVALLRSGKLTEIDIAHIAEEIEDAGKSEKRELSSRMAVLLCHLLKWRYQPERRSTSWQRTIKEQRRAIALPLKETPSLNSSLTEQDWLASTWSDSITKTIEKTGLDILPEAFPWTMNQVLAQDFFPE